MGDVVNLNRYRKSLKRQQRSKTAAENRAKSGRSKAERDKSAQQHATDVVELDKKKLD
jgi:hypothetical protein